MPKPGFVFKSGRQPRGPAYCRTSEESIISGADWRLFPCLRSGSLIDGYLGLRSLKAAPCPHCFTALRDLQQSPKDSQPNPALAHGTNLMM
jgi:hypothetical protein